MKNLSTWAVVLFITGFCGISWRMVETGKNKPLRETIATQETNIEELEAQQTEEDKRVKQFVKGLVAALPEHTKEIEAISKSVFVEEETEVETTK